MMRAQIIEAAYRWIDTPYQHQASVRGVGADCLGLIRGLWRELCGDEPLPVPPYSPDWADRSGRETLLVAAQTCLTEIPNTEIQPGDIMLFRMRPDGPCKHIAVRASTETIIHAYWGRAVVESYLVPYWQRRHTHSFLFPDKKG